MSLDTSAPRAGAHGVDAPDLRLFVFGLFFVFGGITSLNDILIPKLRELFTLTYAQAMLVQSAFFAAYFLVSLPAAAAVRRLGYMRTALLGVLTMAAGCLLFVPASASGTFGVFLFALFVLAAGITTVQVVANPLISLLGPARSAPSRLTFAQAFNSLGTTIFPYVGSILILGSLATVTAASLSGAELESYLQQETRIVSRTYVGLAMALVILAALIYLRRHRLAERPAAGVHMRDAFSLLRRPRFAMGTLGIFLYVGAEVAIGSLIVNFLMQSDTMALPEQAAGKLVPLYWGGALVGRFIGAWLLQHFLPGRMLAAVAAGTLALLATAILSQGEASGWALLAIGLFNAIMFPTIFTLGCEGLGSRAPEGSGVICMAIVGGALVPPLTGHIADLAGLRLSLLVPALCYLYIAAFGLHAGRSPP